ncbi:EXLDI protein [Streptococcus oralis]|nr:EXLDI protein [Streptococcus oralis]MBW8202531.1 EXLDI protein [Streptococcus oralis]
MHYKRVELKVTNQGIHERKIFQGVKIFSRSKLSKDRKSILTQKIYLTPKQNIVYYQRTDINYEQNWQYHKDYCELAYDQLDRETVFKVCQDFDELSPFLENELLEKLKEKQSTGKFFEKLDI